MLLFWLWIWLWLWLLFWLLFARYDAMCSAVQGGPPMVQVAEEPYHDWHPVLGGHQFFPGCVV